MLGKIVARLLLLNEKHPGSLQERQVLNAVPWTISHDCRGMSGGLPCTM